MPRRRTRRSEGRAVPRDAPCRGAHTFGEETVGWCRRRVTVMVVYHRARRADGVLRVVPRVYGFGARLRVLPFPPPARTLFSAPRVLLPPWTRRPAFFSHTLTRSLTRSFRRRERLRPRQSRQARFRRVDARGDFPSFSPSTSSRLRPRRPFPPFLVHQHSLAVPLRRRRGELRFESRDAFLRLSSRRGGRLQGRRLGFPRFVGRRLGCPASPSRGAPSLPASVCRLLFRLCSHCLFIASESLRRVSALTGLLALRGSLLERVRARRIASVALARYLRVARRRVA